MKPYCINCGEPGETINGVCRQCDPTAEFGPTKVDRTPSLLEAAKSLLMHIQRPVIGRDVEMVYRQELQLRHQLAEAIRKIEEENENL